MRALTVRQPWAWAIVHGGKNVENRVRSLGPYRGPVAIHAAARKPDDRAYIEAALASPYFDPSVLRERHSISEFGVTHPLLVGPLGNLYGAPIHQGAVIGVVDLWAAHRARPTCTPDADPDASPPGCDSPWAMPGHWHLMLGAPRPLKGPIAAKGRLGLWRPGAELLAALAEQGVA